jgi:hypothetical protein
MGRKIGSGVRDGRHGLGRKIVKFKTEFGNASWNDVGRRFGISADHARVLMRIASEMPATIVENIGTYKCKAILDGKVPKNHRRAFYRIATMTEQRELRRLIRKLYGDPSLRVQIDEFGCIACGKAIDFDRMSTMQCAKCDGEKPGLIVKVDFRTRGQLWLA